MDFAGILFGVLFGILTAGIASMRGRDKTDEQILWFIVGFIFRLIGVIAVVVYCFAFPKKEEIPAARIGISNLLDEYQKRLDGKIDESEYEEFKKKFFAEYKGLKGPNEVKKSQRTYEVTQLQKLYKLGGVSKEEFEDLKARIINK